MDIPVRTAVFSCFGLILPLTPFVTQKSLETLRRCDLDEQQNRQNHVDDGEHYVVDNGLHLSFGRIPGAFNGAGHIACGGAGGNGHKRRKQGQDTEHGEQSYNSFLLHETSISKRRALHPNSLRP